MFTLKDKKKKALILSELDTGGGLRHHIGVPSILFLRSGTSAGTSGQGRSEAEEWKEAKREGNTWRGLGESRKGLPLKGAPASVLPYWS
jgi:hypothetical protein